MQIVRKSAYRHVFGTQYKEEFWFKDLKPNTASATIAASPEYFAIPWAGGGGSVAVLKHNKPGKIGADIPLISGHTGTVSDIDFSPFNSSMLATGSVDATVKIWGVPEDGIKETMKDPLVSLEGHLKKIAIVKFHPTSSNVIATASNDYCVKIWDIEKGKDQISIPGLHSNYILSLNWNWLGNNFVTTCKDHKLRIFDPRSDKPLVAEVETEKSAKGTLSLWLGKLDQIYTIGFTKMSERQYRLFDPRSMDKPFVEEVIDMASSQLVPHYDEDTSIIYLAGRGDGTISFYEINNEAPNVHYISSFNSSAVQRTTCILPKISMDASICEVTRLYKLTNDAVVPVMFQVPRKSELFQSDIFPDTRGQQPGQSADDFFSGKDADVPTVSMKPGENKSEGSFKLSDFQPQIEKKEKPKEEEKKKLDPVVVEKENSELKARVDKLEKENSALKDEIAFLKKQMEAPQDPQE